uniref:Uncharacterized protein n=1 Tax=Oryza sativa subsp. japonica TaxID=39947 RepID=Q5Z730_ORYSJ|nr:hypothetical protein [Oryza sativa Japonica Group]
MTVNNSPSPVYMRLMMMRIDYKESKETGDTDEIVVEGFDKISRRVGSVYSGFVNFGGLLNGATCKNLIFAGEQANYAL